MTIASYSHDYTGLLTAVRQNFSKAIVAGEKFFCTNAKDLNTLYLDNLAPHERQHHNCHTCRRFIETFGNIVTISEDGTQRSSLWQDAPALYAESFAAMRHEVSRATVTGPFLHGETVWGTPRTGEWEHFFVVGPAHRDRALTPDQAMALQRHNLETVRTALAEFSAKDLDTAIQILEADAVSRSEKFLAPAKWLRALYDRPRGRAGVNLLWRAVASAPEGFCHPKSSVIGALLEDIRAKLPLADIQRRFNAKLHPLRYQRPQAAPSAGTLAAAEALVEKMGVARSLERRFALLSEIEMIWRPTMRQPVRRGGVFGHLKAKGEVEETPLSFSQTPITWEKFFRTVLPKMERLQLLVPTHGNFCAVLTAQHGDSPIIFKYGHPFSSYVYNGGSAASQWGVKSGWLDVSGITLRPNLWGEEPRPEFGKGAIFLLPGAIDSATEQGNALFPENISSELFPVRAAIEAYSRKAKIGREGESFACGLTMESTGTLSSPIRALMGGAWHQYKIDRWD